MHRSVFPLALLLGASAAQAEPYRIVEVASPSALPLGDLAHRTIAFSDRPLPEAADGGLVRFEDWARTSPLQRKLLSLYEGYEEPTISVTAHGVTKRHKEKLHLYVAQARFLIDKPAASIELGRYASLSFIESVDPTIKHERIAAGDVLPLKDPQSAHNQHPQRRWCAESEVICFKSRYQLEGKFPTVIRLINKIDEGSRIADFLEFQSELRVLRQPDLDQASLAQLTGIKATAAGVLEQSIFYVNQMMQFGKLLAVLQPHPGKPDKTVASMFLALAIETDVLELKKDFERYPVLRNLVPAQVLLGKSTFNTGSSLSAGLPLFTRNRVTAIANVLGDVK